jgi:hypothetical protein
MIKLELVSKKRKPVKRYAISGLVVGFLLLVLIGATGEWLGYTLKVVLLIFVACIFVACLYILNYSAGFKNTIGEISFCENYIEIVLKGKREIIYIDNIKNIRFKITGHEGLNTSTVIEYIVWSPAFFSFHNGMNNFVDIITSDGVRRFEFYIPDKKTMLGIKRMAKNYIFILKN